MLTAKGIAMPESRAYLGTNWVKERVRVESHDESSKEVPWIAYNYLKTFMQIKGILRQDISDDNLKYYLDVAMQWVEDYFGKTLWRAVRENIHHNTHIVLPYGPVFSEDDIIEVEYGKVVLQKKDYSVEIFRDTLKININENIITLKRNKRCRITYRAGYEKPEHAPKPLINAVMTVVEYLYKHNGDLKGMQEAAFPLMIPYKEYKVF